MLLVDACAPLSWREEELGVPSPGWDSAPTAMVSNSCKYTWEFLAAISIPPTPDMLPNQLTSRILHSDSVVNPMANRDGILALNLQQFQSYEISTALSPLRYTMEGILPVLARSS